MCARCTRAGIQGKGEKLGQIATTIARSDRGYAGTYNYFDPDNFFSMTALIYSGARPSSPPRPVDPGRALALADRASARPAVPLCPCRPVPSAPSVCLVACTCADVRLLPRLLAAG